MPAPKPPAPVTSQQTPTASTAIALADVAFRYGARGAADAQGSDVLRGITAELKTGKLTALIGPNAAGKTTLLRVMLGQLTPQRGRVTIGGQPVTELPATRRAAMMSYVPQRGETAFGFTVAQVITMGRFALPDSDRAVTTAMERTGVSPLADRVFGELSVGQQQRVVLARALAQSWRGDGNGGVAGAGSTGGAIMLLDEPVSAMDLSHAHQTLSLLQEQANAGAAVLVALHDLNLVARYADEVWLVRDGMLVQQGAWREVLTPSALEPVYEGAFAVVAEDAAGRPTFRYDPGERR